MDYAKKAFLDGLRELLFNELRSDGIKISGNPFPARESPNNGMYYSANNLVMGFTLREAMKANNASAAPCKANSINDQFLDIDRMRVGIHEISHAIIYQKSLVKPLQDAMKRVFDPLQKERILSVDQEKADTIMRENINEAMADAIAAQYMLRRFGTDPRISAYVKAMISIREAPIQDLTHQTQALVSKVYDQWDSKKSIDPRYKLTEAARDVVKMVAKDADAQKLGRDIAKSVVFAPGFRRWMNDEDERANKPLVHGQEIILDAYIGKFGNTPPPDERLMRRMEDKEHALKSLCSPTKK